MNNPISILGEDRFYWYQEDGVTVVSHPKWSTVGIDDDLGSAIRDMLTDAMIIKDDYLKIPNNELSEEAINLKIWLSGIRISK